MANRHSFTGSERRVAVRRQATVDLVLDHAEKIATEHGAGAVTMAEVARRMGMRPPSLYKYFASLHDVYDALFARGTAGSPPSSTTRCADASQGSTACWRRCVR